jgi:hypothetical protein
VRSKSAAGNAFSRFFAMSIVLAHHEPQIRIQHTPDALHYNIHRGVRRTTCSRARSVPSQSAAYPHE